MWFESDSPLAPFERRTWLVSRKIYNCCYALWNEKESYSYSHPEKAPKPKKVVKEETTSVSKRKDYHKHHYCPAPGCMSLVKRIPPHLKLVHKLDPTSKEYKDLLSKVRGPVKKSRRRPYNERPRYARDATTRDTKEEDHASDTVQAKVRFQTLVYLNLLFSLKPGLSLRMVEILTKRQAGSIENKFLSS